MTKGVINSGGLAFPGLHPSEECRFNDPGMNLRDYFAAKAMEVFLSRLPKGIVSDDGIATAQNAYFMADAMLKAREKQ